MKNLENEYPNFYDWYHKKIFTGLNNRTRSILIANDDDTKKIAGISILKNSYEKKICTLRVATEFQHQGIGTQILDKSMEILETNSPLITVSEKRNNEFKNLFQKFNFQEFTKYPNYYREGTYEISYNGYLDKPCLIAIKPEYAFKILSGEKTFEYRKTKTKENITHIVIYAGLPIKKIIGEVQVTEILSDTPDKIWYLTNKFAGMNYNDYKQYFGNKTIAYAYHLQCPESYNPYRDLKEFNIIRPPQSYQYL